MGYSRKKLDLTGQRFGKLTVLEPAANAGTKTAWLCRCDCGKETVVTTQRLRDGHRTSCGCDKELFGEPPSTIGRASLTYIDGTCVEMIRTRPVRSNNTSGVTGVDWLASKGALAGYHLNPVGVTISKDSTKLYYVITFEQAQYKTFVEFYFDEVKDEAATIEGKDYFESILEITPETEAEHGGRHYALDRIENNGLRVSTDETKNVVKVYYGLDEIGPDGPDNVPDKYQMEVMFAGVNGTVDGKTQAERVVTLVDSEGKWSGTGSYTLTAKDIPSAAPVDGYTGEGTWDVNPEGVEISKDSEKLYFVITFEREQYKTFVEFYFDGEKDEAVTIEGEDYFESILTITPEVELDHNGKHYALDKVENNDLRVSTDTAKNVVSVYYGLDENADMVPDKYQVSVMFAGVNGTVDGATQAERVVTLVDSEGKWSETGSYTLTAKDIPAAAPVDGYTGEGTWDVNPEGVEISKDSEKLYFVITFEREQYKTFVEFYFDGEKDEAVTIEGEDYFESILTITPEVELDHNGKHYALDKVENNDLRVSTDTAKNVVSVYYGLDENADMVPDKYQVSVMFAGVNGTVDGKTQAERVVTLVDDDGKWSETGSYSLTDEDIPVTAPAEGYTGVGAWDVNPEGVEISKDSEKLYFVITFEREQYKTFVEFYFDGEKDEDVTIEGEDYFESILTITPEVELDHNGKHYALDKVENNDLRVSTDPAKNVVSVYYGLDENADMVPDKYQVTVTYTATNGSVSFSQVFVTLFDGEGNWSENGTGYLTEDQIPIATSNTGYVGKMWTPEEPTTEVAITGNVEFHVEWSKGNFNYTVNYLNEEGGAVLHDAKTESARFESVIASADEVIAIDGYVFDHASVGTLTIGADAARNVINLYYAADTMVDPTVPEGDRPTTGGDGIADKYQARVTFAVENGTWTGGTTSQSAVVTLMKGGVPAVDGTYRIPADRVPNSNPNMGYLRGSWDRNPNGAIINGDTKFTFTYALIPVIPPVTPPGGGGGGGGTTIPDGPTPLVPDPGTTITDQDVPLAAPGLNNTDHFDYIKGYVIDGQILVRPEANITRAEVATIFFRLMTKEFREANWATENDFTDVKKGDWYNNAISTCTKAGILKGYEDGTFKPNQTISREEFAAIAARFASEEVPAGGMFKDIAGRWSEKDIERAAAMGWIKGSNGLFRPVDKITRAEVIVIVNRMLDRVPDADHMLPDMKTFADNTPDMWWYADVQEATNSHEYDRAEDGVTGIWTSLLPEQDWAALEEEWATAADANVADVAPKLGTEGEKPEEGAKEPETAGGSDGNGEE